VENFPHQHTETVDVHLRSEINHFLLLGEDFGRRPNWARPVSPELIGIHFDIFELESVELHLPLALLGIVRNKDVMRGQAAVRHLHLLQRVKRINNLRNLAEQLKLLKCWETGSFRTCDWFAPKDGRRADQVTLQTFAVTLLVNQFVQAFLLLYENMDLVLFTQVDRLREKNQFANFCYLKQAQIPEATINLVAWDPVKIDDAAKECWTLQSFQSVESAILTLRNFAFKELAEPSVLLAVRIPRLHKRILNWVLTAEDLQLFLKHIFKSIDLTFLEAGCFKNIVKLSIYFIFLIVANLNVAQVLIVIDKARITWVEIICRLLRPNLQCRRIWGLELIISENLLGRRDDLRIVLSVAWSRFALCEFGHWVAGFFNVVKLDLLSFLILAHIIQFVFCCDLLLGSHSQVRTPKRFDEVRVDHRVVRHDQSEKVSESQHTSLVYVDTLPLDNEQTVSTPESD